MNLTTITNASQWDGYINSHPYGHPLQLWAWGEGKRENGWTAHRLACLSPTGAFLGGAQVLVWRIPRTGRYIAYIPRGPILDPASPLLTELLSLLVAWAKARHAIYLRIEPAWTTATLPTGWRQAKSMIQLAGTYTIDLRLPEADLLSTMGHKHRQYLRKAQRDGITVEQVKANDSSSHRLDEMYKIYLATATRAGFGIHTREYYVSLFAAYGEHNHFYYAKAGNVPVAFLWLVAGGKTAYELYGGVNAEGQSLHANYLLKWQAITDLKADGRELYDFNGRLNDGVARFKEGFGPAPTNWVGTWDFPISRLGYSLWEYLWPVAKPVGRRLIRAMKR